MTIENDIKVVKTVCNMCITRCGINVNIDNGKIVNVTGMEEHPLHTLCLKAQAIPELAHSSERLKDPLRKVNGEFKEISWDEAFDFIANKLKDVKDKHGPQAVNIHVGNAFIATTTEKIIRRFSDLYGTPNYTTGGSYCFLASTIGHFLTCGVHVLPNYSQATKCMILWGTNPTESFPIIGDYINAMLGRGAKLIVIDPKETLLAKKADIHAQIRPGTDCALALGMLHVIITEGLYNIAFIEQWTVGFNDLVEHVKDYTPEKVEEITWVKAGTIRDMARMYANSKPAWISVGISTNHSTNGVQAVRAITVLMGVTGNIDHPGGNIYSPALWQSSIRVKGKMPDFMTSVGGMYPLFIKISQESTASPLTEAILSEKPYPIKALLIAGCNPVLTMPNTNKVLKAFKKLDLLVVIDIFMTETAKLADVILPGTSFLERQDIRHWRQGGISLVMATNKVIEQIGNSMEDWKIWAELGKRMSYGEYFTWKDTEELTEYMLEPSGFTLDQLRQTPGGIFYAPREFWKYIKDGFNTPSKKFEIFSKRMEEAGYDPLPTFIEPAESPLSRPDLADKYPLIIIGGPRTIVYLHSEYRNLPSLRKLAPEPLLEINPKTANSWGISDGDLVTVESIRGSIKVKAKLTEDIHPKIVSMQHGWSEANANYLTDDKERDPISGYPGLRSVMCRVVKA
ncbi:molybdopterin-dependent oxidoreductase [Chloroflexota bacterium]